MKSVTPCSCADASAGRLGERSFVRIASAFSAALDMRDRSRAGETRIVDPAGDQVLDGRRRSAVRHVGRVDAEEAD